MKKLALAVVMGSLVSGAALAQDAAKGGWYVGAGLTQVQASDDAPEPKNFVLSLGYEFSNKIGIEYQYSGTYSEDTFDIGDFTIYVPEIDGDVSYENNTLDTSIDTSALFATYVFGDDLYAKVKAGFMKVEYTLDASFDFEILNGDFAGEFGSGDYSEDESETGWAAGVSAGYKFTPHSAVELEYLTTADKIDLNFLNIGYKYSF
jgi:opacity protein-like surface antigen